MSNKEVTDERRECSQNKEVGEEWTTARAQFQDRLVCGLQEQGVLV